MTPSYNRVSDVIRGSTTQYKLANYLKTYHHSASCLDPNSELDSTRTTAPADDKTFRNEFIWHVKSYNETVEPRSRFYIIGFTPCDMEELLASLHQGGDKEPHAIRTATDACYNVAAPYVDRRSFEGEGTTEGTMEAAIMKCLLDSGDKLNDHATFEGQLGKLAISDADTANVITANAKSDAANSDRTNADTANEH